jgi:hypothetical protein
MMDLNSVPQTAELFLVDQFFIVGLSPYSGHLGSRRSFNVLISIDEQRRFCRV